MTAQENIRSPFRTDLLCITLRSGSAPGLRAQLWRAGRTYAAGTVISAVTLTWAGRLLDYTTVLFTLAVTLLMVTAYLLVSGS